MVSDLNKSRLTNDEQLRIFVTVGTTRFDSLIRAVLSQPFLDSIAHLSSTSPKVLLQYGNSSIADILTSSALASVDSGSEIIPEPGLRIMDGRRVYQSSAAIPGLDPGQTGTIPGLRLRPSAASSTSTSNDADAESAGKGSFDQIIEEAQATSGNTTATINSAMQGATLEATTEQGVELELFQFAPDLKPYIGTADVVVSHAGSGTILDTLRMRPKPPKLVVVPNTSLMDNHQVELAEALGKERFLVVGKEETLAQDVDRARREEVEAFPDFDPSRFADIVDDVMQR
ncbi:related to ALG13 - catalytic component of UDP-GlcNAc transferase [Ustilago sp. UG-2017b]|nr:related to ALG13 - catalytic component of UDP-GlcNAc transferase [Ustilago sp. UG-2017b]